MAHRLCALVGPLRVLVAGVCARGVSSRLSVGGGSMDFSSKFPAGGLRSGVVRGLKEAAVAVLGWS